MYSKPNPIPMRADLVWAPSNVSFQTRAALRGEAEDDRFGSGRSPLASEKHLRISIVWLTSLNRLFISIARLLTNFRQPVLCSSGYARGGTMTLLLEVPWFAEKKTTRTISYQSSVSL